MSVSGDDDDLPTCECGQTMTIKKSEKMWHCSVCQEVKAACVLQYICACGRHACDECAWFNAEYADEIEEECEEEYEEWDEYCEIGGYDSWNGCDQYQHQEEGQWQEWEHKGHSPDESEEHGEQNESGAWNEYDTGEWNEYGEWDDYGEWNEYCEIGGHGWSGCDWNEDQEDAAASATDQPLPTLLDAQKATQEIKAALHIQDCNAISCDSPSEGLQRRSL